MCVCVFYKETARASGTVSPTGIASRRERGREKVKERQENWESHKRDEGWRETEWWQQRKPSRRQHVNMPTAGLLSGDEEAAG